MAFETFLTIDKQKPKKGRRLTYLVSTVVHVALLVVGVAASYARVDEVSPKNITTEVTIFQPKPPPPPPPPPPGGRPKPPKPQAQPTERTQPPTAILPPRDRPKAAEEVSGTVGEPGPKNGIPGGVGPGDPAIVEHTEFLPPNVASGRLAIDPQAEEHRAHLSPMVQRSGMTLAALLKVCVDHNGHVVNVTVMRGVGGEIDAAFVAAIRTWRYTPFMVGGHPVPFCTNVRYEVSTSH
jgi:outer membrane biosynthesis protein TonB